MNYLTIIDCFSETQSMIKEPSDEGDLDSQSMKRLTNATIGDADRSNREVQRRYDKLADEETRPLLVGGLYILKKMGNDRLRVFWGRSSAQERASLLQMVHLACCQFTNARKNSTITKTKVRKVNFCYNTMLSNFVCVIFMLHTSPYRMWFEKLQFYFSFEIGSNQTLIRDCQNHSIELIISYLINYSVR